MIDEQDRTFDFVVIGAGIVGAAVARELAATRHSVAMLEARDDIGDGTSKANTAILHTGFDAKPGTLESRMVARGYELLGAYAERTGIPVERTGALLVAWTDEELDALPGLKDKAEQNGYDRCRIATAEDVYTQVPDLGPGALGGLSVPDESIICTWTTNLALASEAVERGVTLLTGHRVEAVERYGPHSRLLTSQGPVVARWVVNAAGLGSDWIDRAFGYDRFTVTPRRGELFVFDKLARAKVPKIVLPVPSSKGKGVLVSPTIYGNVMLGPTAEDLEDREATGTSEQGFDFLLTKGERLMPTLLQEEVTASYAGLRAATEHGDYVVELDPDHRYVVLGGIRSTGLTAGMALAEHTMGMLAAAEVDVSPRPEALPPAPRMPNIGEAGVRPYQDAERIERDPAYGSVVCFCERVTRGEVRDAFASTVPPVSMEGLRRRTRLMNGRCQGFFCGANVQALLESRGSTSDLEGGA
ncbi:NAD(P)/FAD-dependent oxidoreductase [Aeromicrobium sp. CTD01-1L150]|uniref:NAD(P)/FAD-dependent oxidoreductase n=1 Tax=Aeromicrobium sp. CTD01-1L150 TaxID=3341830 RepID=UPI0035C18B76